MKRLLIALFCLAGLVLAQTATPPPESTEKPKWIQKVFDVKYADVNAVAKLIASMQQGTSSDRVVAQQDLRAISVGTYDPSFLMLAEEIIKRYDVPKARPPASHDHGVELIAHILLAGPKGSSGDALPADLEPVVKQLRSVFGFSDIRLLDGALVRGREARGFEVSGMLSGLIEGPKMEGLSSPSTYNLRVKDISVEQGGKGKSVVLEDFRFKALVRYPVVSAGTSVQYQLTDLGFNTDLNVLEGQKVVVGKTHIGETNSALILVLSARVVE